MASCLLGFPLVTNQNGELFRQFEKLPFEHSKTKSPLPNDPENAMNTGVASPHPLLPVPSDLSHGQKENIAARQLVPRFNCWFVTIKRNFLRNSIEIGGQITQTTHPKRQTVTRKGQLMVKHPTKSSQVTI